MKIKIGILIVLMANPLAVHAQWTTNGTNIYNSNTGNVGIGTSSPVSTLDVNGNITLQAGTGIMMNTYFSGGWKYKANAYGNAIYQSNNGGLIFSTFPNNVGGAGAVVTSENQSMFISNNGNVGIGIGATTPLYKLDVNGDIRGYSSANVDISAYGTGSPIYIRSSYYSRKNNFGALPTVNDGANGASLGYVDNFTSGWAGVSNVDKTSGFTAGSYDVYVRIRTDGTGNLPTFCAFGIYDGTTATYPLTKYLTPLSTTYQEIYAGRYVLTSGMIGHNIITFFGQSNTTTNYYLDYVKLVPAPIFIGSNVLVGSSMDNGVDKLQVTGNIYTSGKILIGTTGLNTTPYSLAVNGSAIFTKALVKLTGSWPDYVFNPTYKLLPIHELESFLLKKGHLPDVPSSNDVEKNGIDLGNNQTILLKKIEELTLYVIELSKENREIRKQICEIKARNNGGQKYETTLSVDK